MNDRLKNQLRAGMDAMRNIDLDNQPKWIVTKMMADAMKKSGMPSEAAEAVAIRMKISISQELFENDRDFVNDMADGMAQGIARLYFAMRKDFPTLPPIAIADVAAGFSFEMDF